MQHIWIVEEYQPWRRLSRGWSKGVFVWESRKAARAYRAHRLTQYPGARFRVRKYVPAFCIHEAFAENP